MIHQIDHRYKVSIGFVELLNDLGLNVIHIDNSYYVFIEFLPIDEIVNEITLIGKNITTLVENTPDTIGANELRQRELVQQISVMTNRRRVFAPGTEYVKYLYNG